MGTAVQFIAKTGLATISIPNSNLDGTGDVENVFTCENALGSIIKTIIIKAQSNTRPGMVRLFINKSINTSLLLEISVPATTISGRDLSYNNVIPFNYPLENGDKILAATQAGDIFNIIIEALDYKYNDDVDTNVVEVKSINGIGIVVDANSNLDGSGDLVELFTAGGDGCEITSLFIKAQESVTPGMIRFFIQDYSLNDPVLFAEVIVPTVTLGGLGGGLVQSFGHELIVGGALSLQNGYKILASTEVAEEFGVTARVSQWENP
jgi:hypothetical protein